MVLSLDHPFGLPLPGQSGGYFDTELLSQHWEKAGVEVTQFFWRRPLGAVVRQFAAAGFVMEDVAEARPSSEALMRFPHELAVVADVPSFIAYRLRLASPRLCRKQRAAAPGEHPYARASASSPQGSAPSATVASTGTP